MQTSPGRRERRRERVRAALLDSAMVLFAERGLVGTRVEDITSRADLGKGAFYNYFESKDALIGELLHTAIEQLERDYLAALHDSGDAKARLEGLLRAHDRFFEEHPEYSALFHQARGLLQMKRADPPRLKRVFTDYLTRIARRLVPEGEQHALSQEERLDIAALIAGTIAGYRSYRLATGIAPTITTLVGVLVAGIPGLLLARSSEEEPLKGLVPA